VNLVIRDGSKVLLIDRSDGLGLGLPGGFLGLKESVEAAAIRETKEETGLDIVLKDVLAIFSGRRQGSSIFATNIVYTAKITGDHATRDSLEGKCRWISLDEIERHTIAIDHIDALNLFKSKAA
jgi:8-oxo-dGTP diphosphatase